MLIQEWDMGKALDVRFMEGRLEGKEDERITIARRMLANGMRYEDISKLTGLSIEKIKTLVQLQ